jgi:PBSX family phage terminase large subunit
MKCKICSTGEYVTPEGKQYGICNICNAALIYYKPLPHQQEYHKDTHTFKAIFGAYGSGKTTTAVMELIRHVLAVPGGMSAMLAPTMQMLQETSYYTLMQYLPHTFIEHEVRTRGKEEIILTNGHKILLLPSNSADKLRSLNLSAFYLEEASNAKYEVFTELTARTRNRAAIKDGKNRLLGIVCSNPDVGWVRTEILYKSDEVITADGRVYPRDEDQYNPFMSTHLHSSYQNSYLDPDFQMRISRGKPDWWVARYIHGSFDYAEGMVYPTFSKAIVDPFFIPGHWKRMFSVDFGLRDPTVMLAAAVDPDEGVLYIYDEYYQAETPINKNAEAMKKILSQVPPGLIYGQVIADPAGAKRSGATKRSYFNHYAEYGLWFQEGNNNIEAGIAKVYTYMSMHKLKIFSNCIHTIKEGRSYKYKQNELDQQKNRGEKPVDANNHAMDALRYMLMELPDDPENLATEVYAGNSRAHTRTYEGFQWPKALQDNNEVHEEDWMLDY